MSNLVRKYANIVISLIATITVIGTSGCSHNEPSIGPNPNPFEWAFPLGDEEVWIECSGGTIEVEPFGKNGEDFVALGYIADYPFVDPSKASYKYVMNGNVGGISIADYYNVYGILEHNRMNGIEGYINSDREIYEYDWIKVKCYKNENDSHSRLEITASPNNTSSYRFMYLYFVEPAMGCIWVIQDIEK